MSVRFDFRINPRLGKRAAGIVVLAIALTTGAAQAAIPATERQVLQALYQTTHGDRWIKKDGWNGPAGTECAWHGIKCNADQTHVLRIELSSNRLRGYLPPSLPLLRQLMYFNVGKNELYGPLPQIGTLEFLRFFSVSAGGSGPTGHMSGNIPSLPPMLEKFLANQNEFTGPIPSLSGSPNLKEFLVYSNKLTGPLPALQGLDDLENFQASGNQLTGPIPPLAHLRKLEIFNVSINQLSGNIPALDDLPLLFSLGVGDNQLTGEIPPLQGSPNLDDVNFSFNLLTGPVPDLSGLENLYQASFGSNALSGPLPLLSDVPRLGILDISENALTGTIPALDALTGLYTLDLSDNQLSGAIPSLANLHTMTVLDIANNRLTGPMPAPASPNQLIQARSVLCPNFLDHSASSAWDAATGVTPWYRDCAPPPGAR